MPGSGVRIPHNPPMFCITPVDAWLNCEPMMGLALAFLDSRIASACYFIVAAMGIVPDRRVEMRMGLSGKN